LIEVYKKLFWFLGITILICLSVSVVWSETMGDLIWKDGNYYKKSSNIPFSGKVDGDIKGIFKNGKKEGTWVRYYKNGQLFSVTNYKMGRKDGTWITYNNNGMLIEKGKYKNDLEEGPWIRFFENGEINYKGEFKMEER
jgi:antitoxin component YwqK of YwqJK toxin-antitoxin module